MSNNLNYVFLPTDLPGITFKSNKRPIFNTEVPEADAGSEHRTILQYRVSWYWQIDYEFIYKLPPGPDEMFSFFALMHGSALGFLYRDPSDYLVTVATGTFTPNISDGTSTTSYQIARVVSPTFPFVEKVTNGIWNANFGSDTFQIYDNGSPYFSGPGAVSISSTGQVKFNIHTPPVAGHVLSWAGMFYFPVRFKADKKTGVRGSKFMRPYWAHTIELESDLQ